MSKALALFAFIAFIASALSFICGIVVGAGMTHDAGFGNIDSVSLLVWEAHIPCQDYPAPVKCGDLAATNIRAEAMKHVARIEFRSNSSTHGIRGFISLLPSQPTTPYIHPVDKVALFVPGKGFVKP